jgi:glycosyltransferase involved in cell wall biosynthesis
MYTKVALVYDRVNKWGGAEQVLLALHEIFPKAPLYTAVYSKKHAPWANVFPKIITSGMRGKHELLPFLMPLAFESFNFTDFDLVISITSEAAKGIITHPGTTHVCYCLTPTRYLWSGYNDYFQNKILKYLTKPIISYLKAWDKIAAQRPDRLIAISSVVRERIDKYYDRESVVVYPPVNTKFETKNFKLKNKNYYLIVSRLVPYKKIDIAIKAFNKLGYLLVIVGTGSEMAKLKHQAKKNIGFTGFVRDDELVGYYQHAKALIYPQEEDFGITAVEAQSYGIPVIAYKKGGALDTVIEGKTGVFFDKQNPDSLILGVRKFEQQNFERKDLINNAKRFSKENFKQEFLKAINNV